MGKTRKRMFYLVLISCVASFSAIYFAHRHIKKTAAPFLVNSTAEITSPKVLLVLGTAPTLVNGNPNLYFTNRLAAVKTLYRDGKVKHIILSGDNHTEGYDEPEAMRQALLAMGIPDSVITLDYAGFRTLDSIIRCQQVFGQNNILVVSQKFHNERAVFLGRKSGMEVMAYNASDVTAAMGFKTNLREYLARVKACMDVYVLKTKPKFLGERIKLPV